MREEFFMNCWAVDKLSQYVDDVLNTEEHAEISRHIISCDKCKCLVEALLEEQQFIKETLQTPTLPEDFAALVLDELEPYEQPIVHSKKPTPWKRILLSAAGVALAVSLSATFNPAFAKWIGGVFSTDRVDEGLRIASNAGFGERINQEVTDNGLTFKIEDVVADTSRVAFSYQILNENLKAIDSYFDVFNQKNKVTATDQTGKNIDLSNMSWGKQDEYGVIEFSLREQSAIPENMVFHFDLKDLDGKTGHWVLDVPVDLSKSLKATTTIPLNNATVTHHGVTVNMKEARFAPSSSEILYETQFTEEELKDFQAKIAELEKKFGTENVLAYRGYGNTLQYHIENADGENVVSYNAFTNGKGHTIDFGSIQATGKDLGKLGHHSWIHSFIPQKDQQNLSFVLDGIFKTEPTDFSVTFQPDELDKNPVSFEFEGNFITIKEANMKNKYSLEKSLTPINKETIFTIEMEGGKEATSSQLGEWVLVDNAGNVYPTSFGGSILDEKDKNDRYKTTITLQTYDMKEVPEELTLQLLSITRYYEVEDKWKVPLH
jgi:hypothetical protein